VERSAVYELVDIFKYPGVPDVTFVEPDNFYSLKLALKQPGLGVVIEGPSGIGKTTALKKAIEQLKADGNLNELEVLSARKREDVRRLSSIEQWHDHLLAVDDFHRLDQSLHNHVADYLKEIADRENLRN
jgi:Cdc6-like AAA superfamily ATPase